jgi:glycosyltransferase involved in cell wall biosynthesis
MADIEVASFPLISVVMATYNGSLFLAKQLDSIILQDYPNIEIVISDDKSTDFTVEILEKYRQSSGIAYRVNDTNLGYTKNFEQALIMAMGEFIALSDQDDIWLPNKLSHLYANIRDGLLIHSDVREITREDTFLFPIAARKRVHKENYEQVFLDPEFHTASVLTWKGLVQGCTTLFRRELLQLALPMPDSEKSHDIWLGFVAAMTGSVLYDDSVLTLYRKHGANASQGKKLSKRRSYVRATLLNAAYRRVEYYKRALILKRRGAALKRYPMKLRNEIY